MSDEAFQKMLVEFGVKTISRDFFSVMIGRHLGSGAFREVFLLENDPTMIVKFETTSQSFHNVFEWQTWRRLVDIKSPMKKWFAPCVNISPCGTVLLQRFAEDILDTELPEEVPGFFTDMSPRNWGRYKKKIVCRDYGSTKLLNIGAEAPMRKANWRLHATKVNDP